MVPKTAEVRSNQALPRFPDLNMVHDITHNPSMFTQNETWRFSKLRKGRTILYGEVIQGSASALAQPAHVFTAENTAAEALPCITSPYNIVLPFLSLENCMFHFV